MLLRVSEYELHDPGGLPVLADKAVGVEVYAVQVGLHEVVGVLWEPPYDQTASAAWPWSKMPLSTYESEGSNIWKLKASLSNVAQSL